MSLRLLGYVAIAEALSFVCLLGAMIVKYGFDEPAGVSALGPIHGALFLAYVALVIVVRQQRQWGVLRTVGVLAAAVVPMAGYVAGQRLLREASVGA